MQIYGPNTLVGFELATRLWVALVIECHNPVGCVNDFQTYYDTLDVHVSLRLCVLNV